MSQPIRALPKQMDSFISELKKWKSSRVKHPNRESSSMKSLTDIVSKHQTELSKYGLQDSTVNAMVSDITTTTVGTDMFIYALTNNNVKFEQPSNTYSLRFDRVMSLQNINTDLAYSPVNVEFYKLTGGPLNTYNANIDTQKKFGSSLTATVVSDPSSPVGAYVVVNGFNQALIDDIYKYGYIGTTVIDGKTTYYLTKDALVEYIHIA
jgi:hypothetical protein